MSSPRRSRERRHSRTLAHGKTCAGCGVAAVSIGGHWLLPHIETCPTLATAADREGRALLELDVDPGGGLR